MPDPSPLNAVERDHVRALFLRFGEDYQPDKWDRDDCAICREFYRLYMERAGHEVASDE